MKRLVPIFCLLAALLLSTGGGVSRAAFPGPNGRILFHSNRDGGTDGELFTMKPDGSDVEQLTDNSENEGYACWSPDGSAVTYARHASGDYEIFVLDLKSMNETPLTDNDVDDFSPCWSPNGRRIVLSRVTGPFKMAIFSIPADGTGKRVRLTPLNGSAWDPVWSTDGLIAYAKYDGNDDEIYTMRPDGSRKRQLTDNEVPDFVPDWSPNGERIVFTRILGTEPNRNYEVITIEKDGSGKKNLTKTLQEDEARPVWAPNGRRIAFNRDSGEGSDIVTVRSSDGGAARNLTEGFEGFDYWPDWQPVP